LSPRRGCGIRLRTAIRLAAAALALAAIILPMLAAPASRASATTNAAPGGNDAAAGPTVGSAKTPSGKVVVVVIDRIGLADLLDARAPNLKRLAASGGISLMNARVKTDVYGLGSYLIIGSGGRAFAGKNAGLAFNSFEEVLSGSNLFTTANVIYRSRTGRRAPFGSVANLYIEEMKELSDTPQATSTPGLLGEALKAAAKPVALVGNADSLLPSVSVDANQQQATVLRLANSAPEVAAAYPLSTSIHREASCIAMDGAGLVPDGDVGSNLVRYAGGKAMPSTDFARLVAAVKTRLPAADLLVVDMGQTSRVDEQADFYEETRLASARRGALESCDAALGSLLRSLDLSRDLVVVCTPTPTRRMISDGDLLTPLIVAGPGFKPGSGLTSSSTRRNGLVSNFDIAPTILAFLRVAVPADMEGAAVRSTGGPGDLAGLVPLHDNVVYASNARPVLLKLFAISALVVLLLAFLVSLVRKELLLDHPYFWSVILLALISGPLVYLLAPLAPVNHLYWSIPFALALELALGSIPLLCLAALDGSRRRRAGEGTGADSGRPAGRRAGRLKALEWAAPRALLLLTGATLVGVLVDPFIGSPMSALSPFGSSPVLGSRYYGVGNTYMGVAIGAAILLACLLPAVYPSALGGRARTVTAAGIVLLVTVVILGYPRLGANVGALIAGVAAALVTLMMLAGWNLGWKQVLLVVGILVACVAVLVIIDLVLPGSASHAGRAVTRIHGGGIKEALALMARQFGANFKLIWTSIWRLFFAMGIIAALVWRKTLNMFTEVNERYPGLAAAWVGLVVAMFLAVLINDSGIESGGALMIYFILPPLLLLLSIGAGGGTAVDVEGT
jgi:hypothetical protein